jgi:hypothetical protein
MRLFWTAAGGDRFILERATYADQIKYMCLGGIIVATGVMAGIAGGYAFYTIFEPRGSALDQQFHLTTSILSMVFGTIWGLMIFNIDRFIVTSTGKGDGTEAITWEEFKGAIPRIIMGTIIAITISKPVEIRMFKTEIDTELHKAQLEKEQEYQAQVDSIFQGRVDIVNKEKKRYLDEIDKKESDLAIATGVFNDETKERPEGSPSGYGPDAIAKEIIMNDRKKERDEVKQRNLPMVDSSNVQLRRIEIEKQKERDKGKTVAANLDGLLERIKLSHKIAGFWISLFITLLFLVIELTPIFFKLMLIKTPYDYIEENIKELIKAEEGIFVLYNYHKDKEGQERDLIRNLNVEKIIETKVSTSDIERKLELYALEKYEAEMKRRIDADPEAYVRSQENA